jgi:hypothetical protein
MNLGMKPVLLDNADIFRSFGRRLLDHTWLPDLEELLLVTLFAFRRVETFAPNRLFELLAVDGSRVPEMRKPFDLLAEGLFVSSSRGDRRFIFARTLDPASLLRAAMTQSISFTADAFFAAS